MCQCGGCSWAKARQSRDRIPRATCLQSHAQRPVGEVARIQVRQLLLEAVQEGAPVAELGRGPDCLSQGCQPWQQHVLHCGLIWDVLCPHIRLRAQHADQRPPCSLLRAFEEVLTLALCADRKRIMRAEEATPNWRPWLPLAHGGNADRIWRCTLQGCCAERHLAASDVLGMLRLQRPGALGLHRQRHERNWKGIGSGPNLNHFPILIHVAWAVLCACIAHQISPELAWTPLWHCVKHLKRLLRDARCILSVSADLQSWPGPYLVLGLVGAGEAPAHQCPPPGWTSCHALVHPLLALGCLQQWLTPFKTTARMTLSLQVSRQTLQHAAIGCGTLSTNHSGAGVSAYLACHWSSTMQPTRQSEHGNVLGARSRCSFRNHA